jgi:hypothetical protein
MTRLRIIPLIILLINSATARAQAIDSTLETLKQIPTKYLADIDKKVDRYAKRITTKTERTLTKLSRWENKIKGLLEKASLETAEHLFGNSQPTFGSLLQKIKRSEALVLQYVAPNNKYLDDLKTSLKYIE